jgi:hypothetical protein
MKNEPLSFKIVKKTIEEVPWVRHPNVSKYSSLVEAVTSLPAGQAVFVSTPESSTAKKLAVILSQVFNGPRSSGRALKGKVSLRTTSDGIWIFRTGSSPKKGRT